MEPRGCSVNNLEPQLTLLRSLQENLCIFFRVCRRVVPASEVAAVVARERPASLHHPQLQPAAVGALVPAHLPDVHALDSSVLLPHGLDGETCVGALAHLGQHRASAKQRVSPACFCVGDHHQLHSGDPRSYHGHHFSGSWNQRSRLHGQPHCCSTRCANLYIYICVRLYCKEFG